MEKRSEGEEDHREAELIRCCDGFVSLSLIHPPHPLPCLFLLSFSGVPHSAARKKKIQNKKKRKHCSFTFNLSSVEFWSCVTLDDKGVKKQVSKSLFSYKLFVFMLVYVGIRLFFLLPLTQHPAPCIFVFLFFFLMFVFFLLMFRGRV